MKKKRYNRNYNNQKKNKSSFKLFILIKNKNEGVYIKINL